MRHEEFCLDGRYVDDLLMAMTLEPSLRSQGPARSRSDFVVGAVYGCDMGVLSIWRYPVKAMLGELLRSAKLGPGGLVGDRRWVVRDAATGEQVANKRGPTDPVLRECRAQLDDDETLRITAPDGMTEARGAAAAAELLSHLLNRRVVLYEQPARATGSFRRADITTSHPCMS